MKKNILIVLSIFVLALAGCGNDEINTNNSQSNEGGLLSNLGGTKYYQDEDIEELEACELLTMEMVLEYSQGVSEDQISNFEIFGCQYTWEKSNHDEIEDRNTQIIMEEGFQNIANLNLESSDNTVTLTYNDFYIPQDEKNLDATFRSKTNRLTAEEQQANNEILKNAFDSIGSGDQTDQQVADKAEEMGVGEAVQEKLEEGFTEGEKEIGNSLIDLATSTQGEDIYVDINGIGDKAAWSDYSNKMVVQYNNFIFDLLVDLESDSQAAAEELAKEILEKAKKEL